jgi:transcriptional regulator with XRE-family HTH domain
MNIGNNIKKIREIKNLTQEYIAAELGISRQTYMMIENGQSDVKFESLKKIATILEVNINDIISYDDKMIFNNCTNSHFGYNYQVISSDEKSLYEKLLAEKDHRIKTLEELLNAK